MTNHRKWMLFTIFTIVHGLVVYFLMYKMTLVSLVLADRKTVVGCVLWIAYGAAVFWIANDSVARKPLYSILFGAAVFLCKGIVDMIVSHAEELNSVSYMGIAKNEAVTNIIFGTVLILLVRMIAGKFKISLHKSRAGWLAIPALVILVLVIVFVYLDCSAGNAISLYQYSDINELYQIDAQYAVRFLNIEVWMYVLFYSSLWFALDKMETAA